MTVPNPGAFAAPVPQQPLELPRSGMPAAAPVPRPPLSRAAAHRARVAGGVGGGLAWLGLGVAQACGMLLLLGLGISALLLGIVAWDDGAPNPVSAIWPALLPWLGSPAAIALMAGIPFGLILSLLGLWISVRLLRHPGIARPVGVTWAAFGISLAASSVIGGLGSAVASPFAGGIPGFGFGFDFGRGAPSGPAPGFDPGAVTEWADPDRLLGLVWPFVVLGSLASLLVPIVLSVFAWWWMAHAMRPATPPQHP